MNQAKQTVPQQKKGAQSDIAFSIRGADEDSSLKIYEKARNNLFSINSWKALTGKGSADFTLTDAYGKETDRLPLLGDFIRIHLPTMPEDKFDWVRIETIEEGKDEQGRLWVTIRVRPAEPPREKEQTEHFFSSEATSSFLIEKKERLLLLL